MVHQTPAAKRWTAIIDEQEASGQTIRAFAKGRGLHVRTLSWWRCQLGRSRRQQRAPGPEAVSFDEVRVAGAGPDGTVVIAFDRLDLHVVVDHDTDLALLRTVLGALA